MSAPDVVVVGGGVVGCAIALELTRRGAAVTLFERDEIGGHASGYSFGGLYPTSGAGIPGPLLEPARHAVDLHRRAAPELRDLTGIDVHLEAVESLALATDESGLDSLRASCRWQQSHGFDAEMLADDELRRLAPEAVPDIAGALLQRSHFEVDSLLLTRALARAAQLKGAVVRHAPITAVDSSANSGAAVTTQSGEAVSAAAIVLATGPWAGAGEIAGSPLPPVRPVKGEIVRLRVPGNGFRRRLGIGGVNVGRKPDGLVWAGTTEVEAGFDERPSAAGKESILSRAARIVPALAGAAVSRHTACLRPVSSDGLPIVGPLADRPAILLAAGAGKKGVLLSLVIAEWLAAALLSGSNSNPPSAFLPARFGL